MKIAIWKTGHPIADTVANSLKRGVPNADTFYTGAGYKSADAHIGYGILRGMETIIRGSVEKDVPCIILDRGYFNPCHYDGYYRISLCGTQQTIGLDKLEPDYERLSELGIEFPEPYRIRANAHTLIIPPTNYVCDFFKIDKKKWIKDLKTFFNDDSEFIVKEKPQDISSTYNISQKDDRLTNEACFTNCLRVVTFNSAMGWEALRRGIPVYSDPDHSIIGAYQKLRKTDDRPLHLDLKARRELFAIMSGLQMTLEEIRSGKICTLMEKLLSLFPSSSGGILGNQLQATLPPIPSNAEPITL